MPTTIDIESQRMLLGTTPVRKIYQGTNLLGTRIAELFANGEQGVWYDPSDLSTLFQDSAGTVPVTGVEQPVGLMLDKSGRGNHASQPTTTARPILRARYNLLTQTENLGHADWPSTQQGTKCTVEQVQAPDGSMTAQKLTALVYPLVPIRAITVQGSTFRFVVWLKPGSISVPRALVRNNTTAVNLIQADTSQTRVSNQYGECIVTAGPDGWKKFTFTVTSGISPGDRVHLYYGFTDALQIGDTWSVWHPDFRYLNDAFNSPEYQRVGVATDYDTVGFPHYLRFDGVDDWLVTPTITPGVDKAQVFAGLRKLSDAAQGVVAELSATIASNGGTFLLAAPNGATQTYGLDSKGTTQVDAVATSIAAPITSVVTGLADISGDSAIIRVNGAVADTEAGDQGLGNYLAYPLYIGSRGGTTFPFNGHLYGLIVRFGTNLPTATIQNTEKYINQKTRAY